MNFSFAFNVKMNIIYTGVKIRAKKGNLNTRAFRKTANFIETLKKKAF